MIPLFAGVNHPLWYNNSRISTFHHHALLNIYNNILKGGGAKANSDQKVLELAVCGHKISTVELEHENCRLLHSSLYKLFEQIKDQECSTHRRNIQNSLRHIYITISLICLPDCKLCNSLRGADVLLPSLSSVHPLADHTVLTVGWRKSRTDKRESIRHRNTAGWKANAVSAQIPADVKELTKTMQTCDKSPELTNLPPEKIPVWLDINCPLAADIMKCMIHRYEHRNNKHIGETFRIHYDTFTSPSALYAYLTASYATVLEVLMIYSRVSLASTLWQTILFSLLAGENQELTEESL
ncbi:hypothetical protein J6590_088337 [Homalodisca vitripennis]|nr:hypothetical protein J6590_088337 [Homalodisca vitripennis]